MNTLPHNCSDLGRGAVRETVLSSRTERSGDFYLVIGGDTDLAVDKDRNLGVPRAGRPLMAQTQCR